MRERCTLLRRRRTMALCRPRRRPRDKPSRRCRTSDSNGVKSRVRSERLATSIRPLGGGRSRAANSHASSKTTIISAAAPGELATCRRGDVLVTFSAQYVEEVDCRHVGFAWKVRMPDRSRAMRDESVVAQPQQSQGFLNPGLRLKPPFSKFDQLPRRQNAAPLANPCQNSAAGASSRQLGMPTVLTVHLPGVTCLRGTMLRFGDAPCDGKVEATTCGSCWAHGRGMPRLAAQAIGRVPLAVARRARRFHGRFATALSAHQIGTGMIRQTAEMMANADQIVAVCQWLFDALALNGAAAEKLVLCRQGVSADVVQPPDASRLPHRPADGRLRLLLLARLDPMKGVDVAVRAVRALPEDTPVDLRVCSVPAVGGARGYEDQVRHLAGADPRIRIEGPISRSGPAEALASADVLLAPSIWLETGPLVVLEAQAAGLFVLGSRRGGIAELVREDDSGELVEAGDVFFPPGRPPSRVSPRGIWRRD